VTVYEVRHGFLSFTNDCYLTSHEVLRETAKCFYTACGRLSKDDPWVFLSEEEAKAGLKEALTSRIWYWTNEIAKWQHKVDELGPVPKMVRKVKPALQVRP